MTTNELNKLVEHVETAFRENAPNGYNLGWPENRFEDNIIFLANDIEVENCTDFNYSFCNSYCARFPGARAGDELQVMCDISFIADVFVVYWQLSKASGRATPLKEDISYVEASDFCKRLRDWFQDQGYKELEKEFDDVSVSVSTLELSEGIATLSKCLFHDHA